MATMEATTDGVEGIKLSAMKELKGVSQKEKLTPGSPTDIIPGRRREETI